MNVVLFNLLTLSLLCIIMQEYNKKQVYKMLKILLTGENQVDLRFLKIILEKENYTVFLSDYKEISDEYIKNINPEIIIIDTDSENDEGFDLCKYLRKSDKFKDLTVFLLCDLSDGDTAVTGFECGATDYLSKPINENEVKTRISARLYLKNTIQKAKTKNLNLTNNVNEIMKKVTEKSPEMIFALAKMVQSRDDLTGFHLERLQKYIYVLTNELRKNPKYTKIITDKFTENIVPASSLHDIGKIGIPDKILLKPGRLTAEEFEIVKSHTQIGYDTLKNVEKTFGKNDFLELGKNIAKYHHERPDGNGYPENLKDGEIPLEASIMALIDVYDAVRMKKVYKPAVSHEKTMEIIKNGRGSQFVPDIVDAFLNVEKEFLTVWTEYSSIS